MGRSMISPYNTAGLSYIWSFQVKSPKIAYVDNPTLIWGPRQDEPPRMCACTLHFQKLVIGGLANIFVAACMGLSLFNLCSGLQNTYLFCKRVHFGRSRSFKVIQGRWFWYQSKL